jgi:hypothetical protein
MVKKARGSQNSRISSASPRARSGASSRSMICSMQLRAKSLRMRGRKAGAMSDRLWWWSAPSIWIMFGPSMASRRSLMSPTEKTSSLRIAATSS